jgi:hypothetical protein
MSVLEVPIVCNSLVPKLAEGAAIVLSICFVADAVDVNGNHSLVALQCAPPCTLLVILGWMHGNITNVPGHY